MVTGMVSKFEKYWLEMFVILAITIILDHTYKFNFIKWCYKWLYGGDNVLDVRKVRDKLF